MNLSNFTHIWVPPFRSWEIQEPWEFLVINLLAEETQCPCAYILSCIFRSIVMIIVTRSVWECVPMVASCSLVGHYSRMSPDPEKSHTRGLHVPACSLGGFRMGHACQLEWIRIGSSASAHLDFGYGLYWNHASWSPKLEPVRCILESRALQFSAWWSRAP